MTYRVVFTPSAKEDLRETRDWYDKDGLGLGNVVLNEILASTNRIASNPKHFAKVYGEIRQLMLPRFPYVISFRVRGEQVEVLAILHGHRNPDVWKRRN